MIPQRKLEHFRGVVWKRDSKSGLFRYQIAGMLVTDVQIYEFEHPRFRESRTLLDGEARGISDALGMVEAKYTNRVIDSADDAMLNLDNLLVDLPKGKSK